MSTLMEQTELLARKVFESFEVPVGEVEKNPDEYEMVFWSLGLAVYANPFGGTRAGIGGRVLNIPSWAIFRIEVSPATRWEPEDCDFRPVSVHTNLGEAVASMVGEYFKARAFESMMGIHEKEASGE